MIGRILAIVVCIVFSAFFSGSVVDRYLEAA